MGLFDKNKDLYRNRVDISLTEYKDMENKIADLRGELTDLKRENGNLHYILKTIGITPEIIEKMIHDSLKVWENHDLMEFKKKIRIEFEVNDI